MEGPVLVSIYCEPAVFAILHVDWGTRAIDADRVSTVDRVGSTDGGTVTFGIGSVDVEFWTVAVGIYGEPAASDIHLD
jgi:hypothetical protein